MRESAAEKAERMTKQLLEKTRWTETDLQKHRKGDKVNVRMAAAFENRNDGELEMDRDATQNGPLAQCRQRRCCESMSQICHYSSLPPLLDDPFATPCLFLTPCLFDRPDR